MKNWWLSWYCPQGKMGKFELHWPWWVSGSRMSDDAATICAAVKAESADDAKLLIAAAHDEPVTVEEIQWRFITEQKESGWSPFSERFPRGDWMRW